MSDNQGLRIKAEITISQEDLEEVARAIPVSDLVPSLIRALHGNEELLQGFLTALIRELSKDRSSHLARALSRAVDQPLGTGE